MNEIDKVDFEEYVNKFSDWHPATQVTALLVGFAIAIPLMIGFFISLAISSFLLLITVIVCIIGFSISEAIDRRKIATGIEELKNN